MLQAVYECILLLLSEHNNIHLIVSNTGWEWKYDCLNKHFKQFYENITSHNSKQDGSEPQSSF